MLQFQKMSFLSDEHTHNTHKYSKDKIEKVFLAVRQLMFLSLEWGYLEKKQKFSSVNSEFIHGGQAKIARPRKLHFMFFHLFCIKKYFSSRQASEKDTCLGMIRIKLACFAGQPRGALMIYNVLHISIA